MDHSRPKFKFIGDESKAIELTSLANQRYEFHMSNFILGNLGSMKKVDILPDGSSISTTLKKDMNGHIFSKVEVLSQPPPIRPLVQLRIAARGLLKDNKSYIFGRPIIEGKTETIPDPLKIGVGSAVYGLYNQQSWLSYYQNNMVSFGVLTEGVYPDATYQNTIKVNNKPLIYLDKVDLNNPITAASCSEGANIVFYALDRDPGKIYLSVDMIGPHEVVLMEKGAHELPDGGTVTDIEGNVVDSPYTISRFSSQPNTFMYRKLADPATRPNGYPIDAINYEWGIIKYPEGYHKQDIEFINFGDIKYSVDGVTYTDPDVDDSYNSGVLFRDFQMYNHIPYVTENTYFTGYNHTVEPPHLESLFSGEYPITNILYTHYVELQDWKAGSLDRGEVYSGLYKVKTRISKEETINIVTEEFIHPSGEFDGSYTHGSYKMHREFSAEGGGKLLVMGISIPSLPPTLPPPEGFDKWLIPDSLVVYVEHSIDTFYKIQRDRNEIPMAGLFGQEGGFGNGYSTLKAQDQASANAVNWPFYEDPLLDCTSSIHVVHRGVDYIIGSKYLNNNVTVTHSQYAYDGFYVVLCGTIRGGTYIPKRGEFFLEYSVISSTQPDTVLSEFYMEQDFTLILDVSKKDLTYSLLPYRVDSNLTPLYFVPFIINN